MSSRTISVAAIILLAILSGYLWYSNAQLKKAYTAKSNELVELERIQTQLDADYQEALGTIESLRTDNQELNALIDNQKEELKAQKAKINNLIWTKRELDKAKEEISKFEQLTSKYLAEIEELKSSNEFLAASNKKLKEENMELSTSLTSVKEEAKQLAETKAVLVSEKEDLSKKNKMLSEKVDVGSAIKINWMSFDGGRVGDDGEFKVKKRTKKMEVLRTCFRTETNVVVPAGEETFLIRIINPNGETLSNEEMGSGTVTNKMTGESMRYTMAGTITYNNEDTEACIDWRPLSAPMKGEYKVEIYNKNYLVGQGTFKL